MKQLFFIIAALPLLLSSCNKESGTPEPSTTAVQFSTAITRATGTSWGDTDEIGVFMKTANTSLTTACLASNVLYANSASGFTTVTPIYYPESGAVDFVAYYPYRATPGTDPYIYKVDVSNQSEPTKIDLLYSNDATSKTSTTPTVPLKFSHKLSKLVLTVVKGDGITDADFSGIGIAITGMPTKADFALADGTFANRTDVANITPQPIGELYEAIVIPLAAGTAGRSIMFTVGGQVFTYVIPAATEFGEGKTYTYTVTVHRTGIAVSVGDVTWTSGGNTVTGTAVRQAVVGDYYYNDGTYSATYPVAGKTCIGIVFRAKTVAQTGLVVSLDENSNTKWDSRGTREWTYIGTGTTDGTANMATISSYLTTISKPWSTFPAFKWCADKGAGWYLPAKNELLALFAAYNADKTVFNAKLNNAAGGKAMTNNLYWSSSEYDRYNAWVVGADIGASSSGYKGSTSIYVRAVLAF